MNQENVKLLFEVLRSALNENPLSPEAYDAFTDEALPEIYRLSKKHDIAHLFAVGAGDHPAVVSTSFQKQLMLSVLRYERTDAELHTLSRALTEAKIPYIPLKGSVIRDYYPEPWMRTSCDIDVLVHEEDLQAALSYLETACEYKIGDLYHHDVAMTAPSGVHIELHFTLQRNENNQIPLLSRVWELASPSQGNPYEFRLTPEFLFFHHLSHMESHFIHGGCGIRSLIDLFLLRHKMKYDEGLLLSFLREAGLERFYSVMLNLSEYWFGEGEADEDLLAVERFLLNGGTYGTNENNVVIQQRKSGGRLLFLAKRLFPPYSFMKLRYPILRKHPYLLPISYLTRIFSLVRPKTFRRSAHEFDLSSNLQSEQTAANAKLFSYLGLS